VTANTPTPPDDDRRRPDGADDATIEAMGKLGEALECVERVRGALYTAHQLTGHADLMLDEAAKRFRDAGHDDVAESLERELIGRNLLEGRWTFQIVEEFDDGYWRVFRDVEQAARDRFTGGRRHVFEAEMKERRRTHGERRHESRPSDVASGGGDGAGG